MKANWIKRSLPRGLYGRAALILIVPIVAVQLVVSIVFIQRHFEGVTQQMTRNVQLELEYVLKLIDGAPSAEAALVSTDDVRRALKIGVRQAEGVIEDDQRLFYDLSGKIVIALLRAELPELESVDLAGSTREVKMVFATRHGDFELTIDRKRVSASNPHQLLVLMISTGILMTLIAFIFLRNQLRPIRRLAAAAEAFGKGRIVAYRPTGATEVRSAGSAFLDMRARIERQIEQRTMMLSGVSHDLRTPLTRLKLGLSLQDDTEDTRRMLDDVGDMERMLDAFLDFARADALDDPEPCDPGDVLDTVVARQPEVLELGPIERGTVVPLRKVAVERALQNLINNALNYGKTCRVGVEVTQRTVRFVVEDDGPGIPPDRREAAVQAFNRLDEARNQNHGSGVGLGLAIASDIARSHGGVLRLGDSEDLGGLKAELVLAR